MPRTRGYSKKGDRCFGSHDWGARGRTNAIGALLEDRLLTISLFDCTINTDAFTAWIKLDLLPKLSPGCVLVMDNASFHKSKSMQKEIEDSGHLLEYLPLYSPLYWFEFCTRSLCSFFYSVQSMQMFFQRSIFWGEQ